jgi:hypothetical protein
MNRATFWEDYETEGVQIPDTTEFANRLIRRTIPTVFINQRWQYPVGGLRRVLVEDEVETKTLEIVDEGPLVGELATIEHLANERERNECLSNILRMATEGLSLSFGNVGTVTIDSAMAAFAFIYSLPPNLPIPSARADGEGGVIFVWRRRGDLVLVTIDNWRIHVASAATTSRAEYLEDLPFDGHFIPQAVLDKIAR